MARPRKEAATSTAGLEPGRAAEAFAKVEPILSGLASEAVYRGEADVGAAVTVALGAVAKLRAVKDAFAKELPQYPASRLDELEEVAHAAWFADVLAGHAASPGALSALLDEARTTREGLLVAAEALAFRGLLDKEAVAKLKRTAGELDVAKDVLALAAMFAAEWPRIGMKTAVERSELDRALALGAELTFALGAKQANKAWASEPGEARARAFTLLAARYDEARRAVTYVRWAEGDADAFAPPLAKRRAARKGKDGALEVDPDDRPASSEAPPA